MGNMKKKLSGIIFLLVFIGIFLVQNYNIVFAFYSNYIIPGIHYGYTTITDLHWGKFYLARGGYTTHRNIIVKDYNWRSDSLAWSNLHLSLPQHNSERCLMGFDSRHPWLTFKICGPSGWNSLVQYNYVTWVLSSVLVGILGWIFTQLSKLIWIFVI